MSTYSKISLTVKQSVKFISNLLVLQNNNNHTLATNEGTPCLIETSTVHSGLTLRLSSSSKKLGRRDPLLKLVNREKWDIFYLFTLEIDSNEFRDA